MISSDGFHGNISNWDGMMSGWNGWLWPTLMMLFWAAVIGLGVWAIIRATRDNRVDPNQPVAPESARQILDRRLASGELDSQQYSELRSQIEHAGDN